MIEALLSSVHPRWLGFPELVVPRARGIIDLALGLRTGEQGLACEAQSEFRSIDMIVRRLGEKAIALADLGAVGPNVSTLLLVRATQRTREVALRYGATLAAAFPACTEAALEALTTADRPWPGSAVVWVRVEGTKAVLLPGTPRGVLVGR
jgi:hypothetical protein